jgi:hypothetical protein
MQAAIMHLAIWLPDWNSLDSVRRAHSRLEGSALVFFALLVVFDVLAHLSNDKKGEIRFEKIALWCFALAVLAEIAAYPYGQRNDTLSEQIIGSLDAKAKDAFNTASEALAKAGAADVKSGKAQEKADTADRASGDAQRKVAAVSERAGQIDAELAQAEYLMSARRLENTDKLSDELRKKFKGRDVMLMSYRGDQEGWGLCTQLWYVAKSAEMKPVNQCGISDFAIPGFLSDRPFSALVSPMAISGPNIQETLDVADMLVKIGKVPFGTTSGMPNGMLMIFVGVKPPFMIGQARGVKAPQAKQPNNAKAKH